MSIDVEVEVGARLRRRRRLIGMTQAELASACGVRFQQIQKYECAANRISAVMLWRLAAALGVRVDYFFDGLEDTPERAPGQGAQSFSGGLTN